MEAAGALEAEVASEATEILEATRMPAERPGRLVRAFSLTAEEIKAIEIVRQEEGLLSASAALRRLIRDGWRSRSGVELDARSSAKPGVPAGTSSGGTDSLS